jgi:glycosyltransferase involved in cell wall biosynthesis
MSDIPSDRMIAKTIERLARSISAAVIHVQTEGLVPSASMAASKLQLPLVATLHGVNTHPRFLHTAYQKRRFVVGLASANSIILVGEPLREFFKNYIGSDRNFVVVPNGVDAPLENHKRAVLANNPRRLVSIANLQEGKGLDLTLRALARLEHIGISNWIYRIIGDGPDRAALTKLTTDLGLTDKVTFVGLVRHAEIFNYLACHDIFVLPSYREAFGIAYLEAMAAGLVTIGVMGQGPSQFIRNGENGVLVPPHDVEALVAALRDILTGDRDHWCEIACRGRETVQRSYTWDQHAEQLIDVYEQVIAGD